VVGSHKIGQFLAFHPEMDGHAAMGSVQEGLHKAKILRMERNEQGKLLGIDPALSGFLLHDVEFAYGLMLMDYQRDMHENVVSVDLAEKAQRIRQFLYSRTDGMTSPLPGQLCGF